MRSAQRMKKEKIWKTYSRGFVASTLQSGKSIRVIDFDIASNFLVKTPRLPGINNRTIQCLQATECLTKRHRLDIDIAAVVENAHGWCVGEEVLEEGHDVVAANLVEDDATTRSPLCGASMQSSLHIRIVQIGGNLIFDREAANVRILHKLEGCIADAEGIVETVGVDLSVATACSNRFATFFEQQLLLQRLVEASAALQGGSIETLALSQRAWAGSVTVQRCPLGVDTRRDHCMPIEHVHDHAHLQNIFGPIELGTVAPC